MIQKGIWILVYTAVLIWSGINPKDYFIWFLEVLPALLAVIIMGLTYLRFPLTSLSYVLILIHSLILMVGGHYTYAEVPAFDWLREYFSWQRNNYDKIGHFAQGFVPAIIAREILLRHQVVKLKAWLSFIVICICLAISAFYELIEWWVAVLSATAADSFLGMQGYIWDTQSDMGIALIGAIAALLILSRWQDRQIAVLMHQSM